MGESGGRTHGNWTLASKTRFEVEVVWIAELKSEFGMECGVWMMYDQPQASVFGIWISFWYILQQAFRVHYLSTFIPSRDMERKSSVLSDAQYDSRVVL